MCITKHFKGDRVILVFERPYDSDDAAAVETALALLEKHIRYIASADDGEDEVKLFSRHNVRPAPLQRDSAISLKLLHSPEKEDKQ